MKNLKKIFAVALGLTLMAGVSSCKKNEEPTVDPTPTYDPEDIDLENAKDYLYQQMIKGATETSESYDLDAVLTIADVPYPITWTLTVTSGDSNAVKLEGNKVVVTCEEGTPTEATEYTLGYTIKDPNGEEMSGTFTRRVPVYVATTDWNTLYALLNGTDKTAYEDKTFPFKGVVTSKSPLASGACKNIYIENETGVVVVYNMQLTEEEFDKIQIGSTVRAIGEIELYYGAVELTDATLKVYENVDVKEITPTDVTDVFKAAESTSDKCFDAYANKYVTVKGALISGYDESNHYEYFDIGNITSYIRLSSSGSYLTNTDEEDPNCDYTLLQDKWVMGKEVTVQGLLLSYSGSYYIQPFTAADAIITNDTVTDEVKCKFAAKIAGDDFEKSIATDKEWTLPTYSTGSGLEDVALAFEVIEGNDVATINEGKLSIKVLKETTVKIKVTCSCGDKSVETTFSIDVVLPTPLTVKAFLDAKDTENVQYVKGTVVASGAKVTYKCVAAVTVGETNYAVDDAIAPSVYNALTAEEKVNFEKVVAAGSFVLADNTGAIFSYNKMAVEVGDEVMISGTYSVNSATIEQICTEALLKTYSTGSTKTGELVTNLDKDTVAALQSDYAALTADEDKLAFGQQYTGKLTKVTGYLNSYESKGTVYYSIYKEAETTSNKFCSLYTSNINDETLATFGNVEVDVYGYVRGISSSYVSLQVVGAVAKGETFNVSGFNVVEKTAQLVGNWATDKTGTSYATYDGEEVVGDLTINTTYVLKNSKTFGTYADKGIFQFKGGAGVMTISGVAIKQIILKQHSTYTDIQNKISYQLGSADAVEYTPASVDTGVKNGNYTVYDLTYTIECNGATSVTIKNIAGGAEYFYSFEVVYEK